MPKGVYVRTEWHKKRLSDTAFWKGKKLSEEHKKMMSLAHKGKPRPWRIGMKHTLEARQKMSLVRKGKHYSPKTEFKKGNMSLEKHPFWKGGITPLLVKIRNLDEYKFWRAEVYKRDWYTCRRCGKKEEIEAHHLKSFSGIFNAFLELYDQFSPIEDKEVLLRLATKYEPFWNVNNGKTLCKDCHNKTKGLLDEKEAKEN